MNIAHLAASLALLASPSFAQSTPPTLPTLNPSPFSYDSCFVWPSMTLGDPPRPTKILADQFDRDGLPDAVLQLGDHLAFIGAVASRDVVQWMTMESEGETVQALANDFDIARDLVGVGGGFASAQDASVAYVNAKGLYVAYLAPALTAQSRRTQRFVTTLLLDDGPWLGAKFVRAHDVNADGVTDFVGLAADAITVIVTDGASLGTSTFSAPAIATGLEILRWDANSIWEIALVTPTKVIVMRTDGTIFDLFSDTLDGSGSIGVLKGTARDRLVLTRSLAGGDTKLTVLRSNASPDAWQCLPISAAAAIGAGDLEYDRDDDIAVSNPDTLAPLFVRNDLAAPQFASPNFSVAATDAWIDSPYDAFGLDDHDHVVLNTDVGQVLDLVDPANKFRPLFKDLDNDAHADVVTAAYTTGVISPHALALPVLLGAPNEPSGVALSTLLTEDACHNPIPSNKIYQGSMELYPGDIDTTDLRFTLDMRFNSNSCPNYADTLRVNLWYQPADDAPLNPQAIISWQFTIDRVEDGWNPTNGDDTRLTMFLPRAAVPSDLGTFFTYDHEGHCSVTYTKFCMLGVMWFEVQTLQLNAPNTPIVYNTRVVAFDNFETTSPLVLNGGQPCCNAGLSTTCYEHVCPNDLTAAAADGPIQIIRKPRLPSVGATEFPEVPTTFNGVGNLGSP